MHLLENRRKVRTTRSQTGLQGERQGCRVQARIDSLSAQRHALACQRISNQRSRAPITDAYTIEYQSNVLEVHAQIFTVEVPPPIEVDVDGVEKRDGNEMG